MKKLAIAAALVSTGIAAEGSIWKDPVDGKLDASRWLLENAYGFLPVPFMITDPAIGFGGGVAAVFFHETAEQKKIRKENPEKVTSIAPSMSGIVALGTENGTKIGGGFHQGNWKDDSIRLDVGAFNANININYFGFGAPIEMNTQGNYIYADLDFRIAGSNFFAGAGYHYMDGHVIFGRDKSTQTSDKDVRVDMRMLYENVDNPFSPTDGIKAKVIYSDYSARWGGENEHQRINVDVRSYYSINDTWQAAWRVNGVTTNGDVPFYARPYVEMRGITAMRYQGDNIAVAEAQIGYNITPRWQLVGFTGIGTAFEHTDKTAHWNNMAGVGFRHTIARQLGIKWGVDAARSQHDTTIQIKFGSAF
ncbi:BamA/TamA family outer membrane protein [Vibrio nomapromontoriensis]|uniref:BamA/TamA family outer membrane protein n=1 Tax=Vibrio nomapromontoriensis TaxID=2910246 RepID=UPI003D142CEF